MRWCRAPCYTETLFEAPELRSKITLGSRWPPSKSPIRSAPDVTVTHVGHASIRWIPQFIQSPSLECFTVKARWTSVTARFIHRQRDFPGEHCLWCSWRTNFYYCQRDPGRAVMRSAQRGTADQYLGVLPMRPIGINGKQTKRGSKELYIFTDHFSLK